MIDVAKDAIFTLVIVAGPVMVVGLVVGVIIGLLQAVTQVQETTLTFLPKLVAVALALVILGPWMLTMLVDYLRRMLGSLASITA